MARKNVSRFNILIVGLMFVVGIFLLIAYGDVTGQASKTTQGKCEPFKTGTDERMGFISESFISDTATMTYVCSSKGIVAKKGKVEKTGASMQTKTSVKGAVAYCVEGEEKTSVFTVAAPYCSGNKCFTYQCGKGLKQVAAAPGTVDPAVYAKAITPSEAEPFFLSISTGKKPDCEICEQDDECMQGMTCPQGKCVPESVDTKLKLMECGDLLYVCSNKGVLSLHAGDCDSTYQQCNVPTGKCIDDPKKPDCARCGSSKACLSDYCQLSVAQGTEPTKLVDHNNDEVSGGFCYKWDNFKECQAQRDAKGQDWCGTVTVCSGLLPSAQGVIACWCPDPNTPGALSSSSAGCVNNKCGGVTNYPTTSDGPIPEEQKMNLCNTCDTDADCVVQGEKCLKTSTVNSDGKIGVCAMEDLAMVCKNERDTKTKNWCGDAPVCIASTTTLGASTLMTFAKVACYCTEGPLAGLYSGCDWTTNTCVDSSATAGKAFCETCEKDGDCMYGTCTTFVSGKKMCTNTLSNYCPASGCKVVEFCNDQFQCSSAPTTTCAGPGTFSECGWVSYGEGCATNCGKCPNEDSKDINIYTGCYNNQCKKPHSSTTVDQSSGLIKMTSATEMMNQPPFDKTTACTYYSNWYTKTGFVSDYRSGKYFCVK
jgi:hypothetical protein